MGEVYRARDTNLNRDVALKILPDSFANDPERLARFQQEAEVLASLNHPNIAHVHGLEQCNGIRALVMELVDGEDLAQRIARRAIPLDEALPIAKQIAEALEAAHAQGIIHRDLKPANIKVRSDGVVKVLDFGLAKAMEPNGAKWRGASMSPTIITPAMTQAGMILGTAAYMSPEQAAGKPVDKRSDLWAFGVVVFEMLSGRAVFTGETVTHVLASVLKNEPEWITLPTGTPAAIRTLLRHCLAKDRKHRLDAASDARLVIEDALIAPASETPLAAPRRSAERLLWLAALVCMTLVAAVMTWRAFGSAPATPELPVVSFDIQTPPTDDPLSFALSPDGRQLVFVANNDAGTAQLWIRSLDTASARRLAGTEGAFAPFWSPDSRVIGFFADRRLKRIDLAGGALQDLADAPGPRGGAWNRDGVILFAPTTTSGLAQVIATGGPVTPVIESISGKRGLGPRWPQFLPDGRRFLFEVTLAGPDLRGIYLGNLDGGTPTRLMESLSAGTFTAPGSLLVSRQDVLFELPFDLLAGSIRDTPLRIAENVVTDLNGGRSAFSISSTGVLASRGGRSAQRRHLVWVDRSGRVLNTVGPDDGSQANPELAANGRRVVIQRAIRENVNLWLIDARGVGSAFTVDEGTKVNPLWSADGGRIVFGSNKNGVYDLFQKSVDGGADEQPLLVTPQEKRPVSWSSNYVLYGISTGQSNRDLWALPMAGDAKPFPVVHTSFDEDEGQFSPDGRWLAYGSTEAGNHEIYVQPFPGPGEKKRVSPAGGGQVRWRPDGRELYYVAADNRLMAVSAASAKDGRSLELAAPVALFPTRFATGANVTGTKPQYAVASDGRFLLNERIVEDGAAPITIVQNWMARRK